MHTSSFARILNAKPLLLTEEKRVLHFPVTNKVRIDNNVNYEPRYRKNAEKYSRQEFDTANTISSLPQKITPPVSGYTEKGNLHSYSQGYGGRAVNLDEMTPKEQYKLGSQIGRQQNALRQNDLGHTDLHSGNIVKPNPSKRKAYLIDNDSFQPINDFYDEQLLKNLQHENGLGKPFITGYNSRINFTQQKQMQHFANFGLGQQAMNYLNQHPMRVATGATALAGAVKGSGVFETEEEKANTSGLGRLGKIASNSALGAAVGAGGMLINQKATQLGAQAAQKYKRGITPDPYANPVRQSGQIPRPIEID